MTKLDINSVYVGFTFFSYTKKSLVYFVSLRIYYLIVYLKISPFSLSILETLEDKFNNVGYFLSEMIKPIIMLYLQSHMAFAQGFVNQPAHANSPESRKKSLSDL